MCLFQYNYNEATNIIFEKLRCDVEECNIRCPTGTVCLDFCYADHLGLRYLQTWRAYVSMLSSSGVAVAQKHSDFDVDSPALLVGLL